VWNYFQRKLSIRSFRGITFTRIHANTYTMPNDKDELVEQHGSEKNNDKPIGVDENGRPVVPPNIDQQGDGSGAGTSSENTGKKDETIGVP
jgi:hypothetical protein